MSRNLSAQSLVAKIAVSVPRRAHVFGYREDADVLAAVDRIAREREHDRSDVLRAATRHYVEYMRSIQRDDPM